MSSPTHWRSIPILSLLLCLLPVHPAVAQSSASDAEVQESADQEAPSLALCTFVAQVNSGYLPVNVYGLRHRVADGLKRALDSSGLGVCASESVEAVMQAHRLRNLRHIELSALQALSAECGAEFVLLSQFYVFDRDMMLLVRVVEAESADIVWVGGAESLVAQDGRAGRWTIEDFSSRLDELTASAVAELELRSQGGQDLPSVAMFPTLASDELKAQAELLMISLMDQLMTGYGYRIPDPGWVAAELRQRGIDPRLIGERARGGLESALGVQVLLFSELISYDPRLEATAASQIDDLESAGAGQFFAPFLGCMRAVSADSGDLLSYEAVHAKRPKATGIFGIEREFSWVERFEELAEELTKRFPRLEQTPEVE